MSEPVRRRPGLPRDTISLRGIGVPARHGVLPHEKTTAQPFVVDVDLEIDLAEAGASDELGASVSYADVAARVVDILRGAPVDLIERLAELIAEACLGHDRVEAAHVTVHKPHAPVGVPFGDVAVTVHRRQDRIAVIALGGNLGDRVATLSRAAHALDALPGTTLTALSGLLETDPVGGPEQGAYLNAIALLRTSLHPGTLLAALHQIEADAGRRRTEHWGPRTLDLDLIQVGDPVTGSDLAGAAPGPVLPHPRAHERAFVLLPWLEVDPAAGLRVDGATVPVAQLLARLGAGATGATGATGASATEASGTEVKARAASANEAGAAGGTGRLPPGLRPGPPWPAGVPGAAAPRGEAS